MIKKGQRLFVLKWFIHQVEKNIYFDVQLYLKKCVGCMICLMR